MYHSDIKLKEGAFFISDAHYSSFRPDFLDFLKAIKAKRLLPTQIILMGDIFDALFGEVAETLIKNKEAIDVLNQLSNDLEIIYLEGNHDFNLKNIFLKIKVFPIFQQVLVCTFNEKKVILAHGDFDGTLLYKFYTIIIRNSFILKFLNLFDTYILKKLDEYLGKKDDCKKLEWFEGFIQKRVTDKYKCNYFIEGHFHQNVQIKLNHISYINLGAFACNQRYFIVELNKDRLFLREDFFMKET